MMVAHGLTAAITNPIEPEIKQAILAADVFMGHDENCVNWIMASRALASGMAGDEGRALLQRRRRERRDRLQPLD
jgi:5-methyltetrahydrofolate--homocysteine methyltransferase